MHQVAIDRSTLVGRDFIETLDWTVEEIEEALAVAGELKTAFRNGEPHRLLPDRTLFMLFLDKSTRTRNAFESGMTQLGGHAIYLDAEKTQVAHGESPKDMGIILSRYGHGLAIRHDLAPYEGNAWMREIARWADIPLINLQCDVDHPTQTLADPPVAVMSSQTAAFSPMSTLEVRVGSPERLPPYAVRPDLVDRAPSCTQEGHWKPTAAWFMQSGQIGRPQRWQLMWVSRSGCR